MHKYDCLPDPIGITSLVSCYNFCDCKKFNPLSDDGIRFSKFSPCLETTLHNLEVRLHPIPNFERCDGQMVSSSKFEGVSNNPHRASINCTSVSTPLNPKYFLWFVISFKHDLNGTTGLKFLSLLLVPHSSPKMLLKEHDIA